MSSTVQKYFEKYGMAVLETIGAGVLTYGLFYLMALCFVDCDLELAFYSIFGKSPRKLKGKVVFITGASSGIGEHTAKALAKHGVRLVLTARRQSELERVKIECLHLSKNQLSDKDILVIPFDITDLSAHKRVFQQALNHFGTVHVLVNNAGRSQRALFEYIDMSVDKQMFDLNVFAVVNLTRIAINHFNEKGSGHVAVVSSLAGVFGAPYSATYTATKHAIHGYFDALRIEKMDKNIAVTLLCPGPTLTNFLQESFTERDGQKYGIPADRKDRRMTGERCGQLCAIALANRTQESWMGLFPMMPFVYTAVYFPTISKMALGLLGPRRLFKMRDSKDIQFDQGKRKL
ncbi:dehydrogenase/reductase SDR family member 7 [Tribolium castaneum]|uniref:Dehydrogenase/reductase SDR family protein 7-like n=1 Tax=Tribolium castaneum TaxID=7070 RepID=D6WIQ2_TRICA|nr:PREDICTED: dehydrogenase/reductase SDR family member 7 [Tribolium castaneum]EFA00763.2 Dehydrogenase/reductase SDR family protein 7-like [Tribolium castaneum]|eukprot:XP_972828.3 PREDICTED: dehydrogenase/reductase SDR family member 7 [Tribolium castaneum]